MVPKLHQQDPVLPLVGREAAVDGLRSVLARGGGGPTVLFLTGEQGIGKTRLARVAAEEAARLGHAVISGQAFPVGNGAPYGLFADAFTPFLRELEESALNVLTRGSLGELARLFPAAVDQPPLGPEGGDANELKTRTYWAFAEFLKNLADRAPVLVVLEDVHWADDSSLELLHFVARQTADSPILFLCSYTDAERSTNPTLVATEVSLADLGLTERLPLAPITLPETLDLLEQAFTHDRTALAPFATLLYGWTRGNPSFIDATLRDLQESGVLTQRDGTWWGWDIKELKLPGSIAEAVLTRFDRLSSAARTAAEVMSVFGSRAPLEDLEALDEIEPSELVPAMDELRNRRLVDELEVDGAIVFEFTHPMLLKTVASTVGLARRRELHGRIGAVLERRYGSSAMANAESLARHFSQADPSAVGDKAVHYLAAAGRAALRRHANREAERYLEAAVRLRKRRPADDTSDLATLTLALGRAQHRLGDSKRAIRSLEEALAAVPAEETGTAPLAATIRRRLGLIHYWEGRHQAALEHFNEALATAPPISRERAEIFLALGACLQELGRPTEAEGVIEEAHDIAVELDDTPLEARVARAFVLLYAWTGPPSLAREHGNRALTLAAQADDGQVAFWAHWGLALSAAMTGHAAPVEANIEAAQKLADDLGSPVLRIWLAEIAVELYYATGSWDRGIAVAERAIAVARSLGQTALTVRLLVLASVIHLERGDVDRGRAYVDEAWERSRADHVGGDEPVDLFMVIPAHVGRAACALWEGDYARAVEIGTAGVALAENSGYRAWTLHRLLPIVGEAYIMLRDLDGAAAVGEKLRTTAEGFEHALGKAWASACDAVVIWLRGDSEQGAVQLRAAAEVLESIPMIPYAARIRRQLAGRLAETGDRDASLAELRRVHEIFAELGASGELTKTREMFREIEARPPRRTRAEGVDGLTGREVEISRLVAQRKSNKAIAKALDISARTVSTHLSNIFKKLGVGSRGELADVVRERGL